jgi:hypothetical protein
VYIAPTPARDEMLPHLSLWCGDNSFEMSHLETGLTLVTIQCERLQLEYRFAIWAASKWRRTVLPHVKKSELVLATFSVWVCTCVFVFCDVTSCGFTFCLCCALYSPLLVLAWRIHDISPCYGGLAPRLLYDKGLVCPKRFFVQGTNSFWG